MDIAVTRLDHFVITVADREKTRRFYQDILGLEWVVFGEDRPAILIGDQKINVHVQGREISPHAHAPTPGSADFCLIADTPVETVAAGLRQQGIRVELGPVPRTGSQGPLTSIYLRDPDGNLVEIANRTESPQ